MSHTNNTPNYSLPQFISTDTPAWMTDVNSAMSTIDTGMKNNADNIGTAQTDILALQTTVNNNIPAIGNVGQLLTKTSTGATWQNLNIDNALSDSSNNPVTNSAITTTLQNQYYTTSQADAAIAAAITALDNKIVIVTGTFKNDSSVTDVMAYPPGFNYDNCVIIGWEVFYNSSSWITGEGFVLGSESTWFSRSVSGLLAYNNSAILYGSQFHIILKKI